MTSWKKNQKFHCFYGWHFNFAHHVHYFPVLTAAEVSPHICYAGISKADAKHPWRWTLTEINPCDCTQLFTADKLNITHLLRNMMRFYDCKLPGRSELQEQFTKNWAEECFYYYLKYWINFKLLQIILVLGPIRIQMYPCQCIIDLIFMHLMS